jgi:hypothetical protein
MPIVETESPRDRQRPRGVVRRPHAVDVRSSYHGDHRVRPASETPRAVRHSAAASEAEAEEALEAALRTVLDRA